MADEPDLLSKADTAVAFQRAGVSISGDQLERWRRYGLLPRARQIGLGRGRGSRVEMTRAEIVQALEILRLFAIREKREWVGWQLWLCGYQVSEDYWRLPLAKARRGLRAARRVSRTFDIMLDDSEAKVVVSAARFLTKTPFSAAFRKLGRPIAETMIGFATDIIIGRFSGFSSGEAEVERSAVISMIGAERADSDSIDGHKLAFRDLIEDRLRDVSKSLASLGGPGYVAEPSIALRKEFLDVVGLANSLIAITSALPPKGRPLGLGVLARILRKPSIGVEASMFIIWQSLQQNREDLLLTEKIAQLAAAARCIEVQQDL